MDRSCTKIAKETLEIYMNNAYYFIIQKIEDLYEMKVALAMQINLETDEKTKKKYEVLK
jgi:hypothetical protein